MMVKVRYVAEFMVILQLKLLLLSKDDSALLSKMIAQYWGSVLKLDSCLCFAISFCAPGFLFLEFDATLMSQKQKCQIMKNAENVNNF